MATKRISDLTAVNLVSSSALFPIVQDGATVAVTFGDLTGSIGGTTTASYALTAETASYAISASYEISYETSSSYAETATTASYALVAEAATSASYAATASSALTAELGVYSDTARTQYIGSGLVYFDAVSVDGTTGLTTLTSARVNNGFTSKAGAEITGSVDVKGNVEATSFSGSFSGSFEGDGSGLTGIAASAFPYTGDAQITGSLTISGSTTSFINYGKVNFITNPAEHQPGYPTGVSFVSRGMYNLGIGYNTLGINAASLGAGNIALGDYALGSINNQAFNNTAVGTSALSGTTTGDSNTAVGSSAFTFLTTGNYNVGVGQSAGQYITTGTKNTAIGFSALSGYNDTASKTLRSGNIALGYGAGANLAAGDNNLIVGTFNGILAPISGSNNIILRPEGGSIGGIGSGSNNVLIGDYDYATIFPNVPVSNTVFISNGTGSLALKSDGIATSLGGALEGSGWMGTQTVDYYTYPETLKRDNLIVHAGNVEIGIPAATNYALGTVVEFDIYIPTGSTWSIGTYSPIYGGGVSGFKVQGQKGFNQLDFNPSFNSAGGFVQWGHPGYYTSFVSTFQDQTGDYNFEGPALVRLVAVSDSYSAVVPKTPVGSNNKAFCWVGRIISRAPMSNSVGTGLAIETVSTLPTTGNSIGDLVMFDDGINGLKLHVYNGTSWDQLGV